MRIPFSKGRRDLTPSSAVPIAYFAFAHLGFAVALAMLVLFPQVPGRFFYHPRMVALVHLVTLSWLSGSILGAFYIVAPLVLRMPMPVSRADWVTFVAFATGTIGMVTHFWIGEYHGMVWSAALVLGAIGWVAIRAWRGLRHAPVPGAIKLHVGLAFGNILAAGSLGILLGLDRSRGFLGLSPLAVTYAHAHLAAVGWVAMMVVGLGYRLIPMMLPTVMPVGRRLAVSAVLMQVGVVIVVATLLGQSRWVPVGGALIVSGIASFAAVMRGAVRHRMPRPPALPRRDWSAWQAHAALVWLLVAVCLGLTLSLSGFDPQRVPLMWCYGVAGLVGFLAQMVVGIQGRLLPMYAWYRALAARNGVPPARAVHDLVSAPFARAIFWAWTAGVPLLGWGLAFQQTDAIAVGAAALLSGIMASGAYISNMLRAAGRSVGAGITSRAGTSLHR